MTSDQTTTKDKSESPAEPKTFLGIFQTSHEIKHNTN
jgi:hypothetical protein